MAPPVPAGFVKPDLASPISLEALLREVSNNDVRVRGMFMQGVLELCAKQSKPITGFGPYIAFKDYEVKHHVELLAAAAKVLHPNEPLRSAFRMLGRTAYDTMVETMIGRVIFGVLGRDIVRVTKHVAKAYEIAGRGVTARLLELGPDYSRVAIDGAIGMVDNYHVGAFEGVCAACGQSGEVWAKVNDNGGELFTVWRPVTSLRSPGSP
jgi:uncharacterized protein (TIGR02265 family)